MGFYAPAQIVRDAREHGVAVLPVDVNYSAVGLHAGRILPGTGRGPAREGRGPSEASRLDQAHRPAPRSAPGRRAARTCRRAAGRRRGRRAGPIAMWPSCATGPGSARRISSGWPAADCFGSLAPAAAAGAVGCAQPDRRGRPAAVRRRARARRGGRARDAPPAARCRCREEVVADYQTMRLSLKAHPMSFLRAIARRARLRARLRPARAQVPLDGQVAGVVLIRQRPGQRQGRGVHHAGGRDRRGQPGGLARY